MASIRNILGRPCWIFDLDGTLTLPVHDFAAIRNDLGIPVGSDIIHHLASLPAVEARAKRARLTEIEYQLSARTAASPGAGHLLSRLQGRGVRLGILTRNTREIALHTLERIGLADYFTPDCILGRDEAEPKPDPDGIAKLLSHWGRLAVDAVMVGDYLFDLQTGRAAGTATIHVDSSRAFPWPDLADLRVGSLDELAFQLP